MTADEPIGPLDGTSYGEPARRFRIRTVVFDLDGTLADTAPDLTDAVNVMLRALGRRALTVGEVRAMLGDGLGMLTRRALGMTGPISEAIFDEGFALFAAHYEVHFADRSRPWPGVDRALSILEVDGVRLAICTNKLEYLTHPFLAAMGWEGRFAPVICGDMLPVRKPDPAPLLEAIRQAGKGPAAFVGDTKVDLMTARAAGVPCLLMNMEEGGQALADAAPGQVFKAFSDLPNALAAL